jgi:hypothetical protein
MKQVSSLALTLVLATTVVTLPLGRAEHIHPAGIEGRDQALIHAHPIQLDVSSGIRAPVHGDHGRAIFLTTVFESAKNSTHPIAKIFAPAHRPVLDPGTYTVRAVTGDRWIGPPGPLDSSSVDRAPPHAQ